MTTTEPVASEYDLNKCTVFFDGNGPVLSTAELQKETESQKKGFRIACLWWLFVIFIGGISMLLTGLFSGYSAFVVCTSITVLLLLIFLFYVQHKCRQPSVHSKHTNVRRGLTFKDGNVLEIKLKANYGNDYKDEMTVEYEQDPKLLCAYDKVVQIGRTKIVSRMVNYGIWMEFEDENGTKMTAEWSVGDNYHLLDRLKDVLQWIDPESKTKISVGEDKVTNVSGPSAVSGVGGAF